MHGVWAEKIERTRGAAIDWEVPICPMVQLLSGKFLPKDAGVGEPFGVIPASATVAFSCLLIGKYLLAKVQLSSEECQGDAAGA